MYCIDDTTTFAAHLRRACRLATLTVAATIAGCSSVGPQQSPETSETPETDVAYDDAAQAGPAQAVQVAGSLPKPVKVTLPAPASVRTWQQLHQQAAHRIVAANPNGSYTSAAPDVLLAIPVLEIELNANGSIRRITVLRYPKQAKDTTQLAIDAVRRAAPFGDVSRLSKPWKFSETFLFNDDRLFKPRSLE